MSKPFNKIFSENIRSLFKKQSGIDVVNISWWKGKNGKNWGDALNPVLAEILSGKKIKYIPITDRSDTFRIYMIGSILGAVASANCVVWGSGLIEPQKLKVIPRKILAVRGPLTRNVLMEQHIECPEIYGDPALLYPRFYKPKIDKKYKVGIIPHYVDANNLWIKKHKDNKDILVINILDPLNTFVDNILSCECILSSSLHGIIAADAYGIPSLWIEFSNKVIGDGFKFKDYFASVCRDENTAIQIKPDTNIDVIIGNIRDYKINIDLEKLYRANPFFQLHNLKN
jgi:pyruvyltransferase